jgi:hypothetical protein
MGRTTSLVRSGTLSSADARSSGTAARPQTKTLKTVTTMRKRKAKGKEGMAMSMPTVSTPNPKSL